MSFVFAYHTRRGTRHLVPEHYLTHPILGNHLSRTKPKRRQSAEDDINPADAATDSKED